MIQRLAIPLGFEIRWQIQNFRLKRSPINSMSLATQSEGLSIA